MENSILIRTLFCFGREVRLLAHALTAMPKLRRDGCTRYAGPLRQGAMQAPHGMGGDHLDARFTAYSFDPVAYPIGLDVAARSSRK